MGVRRVVTGHNGDGKSIVLIDEVADWGNPGPVIWTTDSMPASNDGDADAGVLRDGLTIRYGTVMRVGELQPGMRGPMHRTSTIDYGFVLEGECDMELDEEKVHLKAGDVVVQRGTNHAWVNNSGAVCKVATINIDAFPVMINGEPLPDTWPGPRK